MYLRCGSQPCWERFPHLLRISPNDYQIVIIIVIIIYVPHQSPPRPGHVILVPGWRNGTPKYSREGINRTPMGSYARSGILVDNYLSLPSGVLLFTTMGCSGNSTGRRNRSPRSWRGGGWNLLLGFCCPPIFLKSRHQALPPAPHHRCHHQDYALPRAVSPAAPPWR